MGLRAGAGLVGTEDRKVGTLREDSGSPGASSSSTPLLPHSFQPSPKVATFSSMAPPVPHKTAQVSLASAAASEALYCLVSAGTILFNKHALSSFHFPAPNALLLFQFGFATLMLKLMQIVGIIHLDPLRWELVKKWAPAILIFVAMNITGFLALQHIGAGMFTVLKNLSNLMTLTGDWFIFGNTYSWQVWGCIVLMILSAMMGGMTDAKFSLRGYAWQMINCVFTAAYSLYLSGVIKQFSVQPGQAFNNRRHLSELSMVYYNNILSVPPLALLSLVSGDVPRLMQYSGLYSTEFQIVAVLGAVMGFLLSFASIWCMARTSPTIYSLTGSLNKVIVAVIGMWFFKESASFINLCSIATGLAAGVLFVFAKSKGPGSRREATPEANSGRHSDGGWQAGTTVKEEAKTPKERSGGMV